LNLKNGSHQQEVTGFVGRDDNDWWEVDNDEDSEEVPQEPIAEEEFLRQWNQAIELTKDNEIDFIGHIGNRILVMKDFPACNVAVLVAKEIGDDLFAISHRWDSAKMTYQLLSVVDLGEGLCYYWKASVEFGIDKALLQIPNAQGKLWMDQLCIPQHVDAFKGSQIQFMGKLYTQAISVISGSNAVSTTIDTGIYLKRAWTQQEFSFGKVMLHPNANLTVDEKILFLRDSFTNCECLYYVVMAAVHHAEGLYWIESKEMSRIEYFDSHLQDTNPALKAQVHALWDEGWRTFDKGAILKMLEKFRMECKWDGSSILGPGPNGGSSAFKNMFYCDCYFPKDQLFGMMGAAIYSMTGMYCMMTTCELTSHTRFFPSDYYIF
jgi:hypothetical protein